MPRIISIFSGKWITLAIVSAIVSVFFFCIFDIADAKEELSVNPLCQQINFQEFANKVYPTMNSIAMETNSPIIPDGEILNIEISVSSKEDNVFCAKIYDKHKQIKDDIKDDIKVLTAKNSEGKTILTIKTPSIGWDFYPTEVLELVSIPFDKTTGKYLITSTDFYISKEIQVSSWPLSFIGSIAIVIIVYLIAAIPVYNSKSSKNINSTKSTEKGFWQKIQNALLKMQKYLDLVSFTADRSGKASIANLQITWFTLVVFGLLIHILLRTQQLSAVSEDILWLLGISSTGKILSMGVDVATNSLSLENLSWLRNQGWLKDSEQLKTTEWKDLINTNGSFDVYKYQLLIFSFIVGMTLTISGLSVLMAFKLPQGFIYLLGLSNVVYVLGSTTSPQSIAKLNEHINQLRDLETQYDTNPDDYLLKARDVANMLTLIYGKEATKFNPKITRSLLEPKKLEE